MQPDPGRFNGAAFCSSFPALQAPARPRCPAGWSRTMTTLCCRSPPRPGRRAPGREYYFVSPERFEEMVEGGQFLEWAHVHDHRYGTPRAPVEAALSAGQDVLFDIDWQGAAQVHEAMPEDSVRIFVLPPSWADLARRLNARAQDSDLVIQRRLERGREEITHWDDYDYVIVNKNFDRAYADLGHIYRAERMKPARNPWLPDFVRRLGAEPLS
jgi:guanylate kinase